MTDHSRTDEHEKSLQDFLTAFPILSTSSQRRLGSIIEMVVAGAHSLKIQTIDPSLRWDDGKKIR